MTEWNDVVGLDEGESAFGFKGEDCGIPRLSVRGELLLPDVAGALVIDHLECPGLIGFEAANVYGEWVAVDDNPHALS